MTNPISTVWQANPFMVIFGGVVVGILLLYALFMAIDGLALEEKEGIATVVSKEVKEEGQTYVTQVIGGRTQTLPQITPEAYMLILDISGNPTSTFVEKNIYHNLNRQDQVTISYQQRRLTGQLQVLTLTP